MGLWLGENYGRMIDLFRRFDEDHSGKLSYDEFFQGLKELGACAYFSNRCAVMTVGLFLSY